MSKKEEDLFANKKELVNDYLNELIEDLDDEDYEPSESSSSDSEEEIDEEMKGFIVKDKEVESSEEGSSEEEEEEELSSSDEEAIESITKLKKGAKHITIIKTKNYYAAPKSKSKAKSTPKEL